jgi:hypothetical protein
VGWDTGEDRCQLQGWRGGESDVGCGRWRERQESPYWAPLSNPLHHRQSPMDLSTTTQAYRPGNLSHRRGSVSASDPFRIHTEQNLSDERALRSSPHHITAAHHLHISVSSSAPFAPSVANHVILLCTVVAHTGEALSSSISHPFLLIPTRPSHALICQPSQRDHH